MKTLKVLVIGMVFAVAGLTASYALADKPPAPPGEDPCSHGRSDKPCRPDPSPNGKDCEQHGSKNGGKSEDHCQSATTTETTETTTTTQTTTQPTTTTTTTETTTTGTTTTQPTTTQETTTSSTPTAPTNPTTTTGTTTTQQTTPAVVPPAVKPPKSPPVTKKKLNKGLNKQAKKANPAKVTETHPQAAGELPNTGLPLGAVVALGALLTGAGWRLRRMQ